MVAAPAQHSGMRSKLVWSHNSGCIFSGVNCVATIYTHTHTHRGTAGDQGAVIRPEKSAPKPMLGGWYQKRVLFDLAAPSRAQRGICAATSAMSMRRRWLPTPLLGQLPVCR